jgi:hypothetical protein
MAGGGLEQVVQSVLWQPVKRNPAATAKNKISALMALTA